MAETANAIPAKEFFIRMLTRDISLADCILDLLDNAVDGAHRTSGSSDLSGFYVQLHLASDEFVIEDNCGGIPVADAKEYAFNFGRRKDAPTVSGEPIGTYGIGMKRALFKLGNTINITSSTKHDSFRTIIDVEAWEAEDHWVFSLIPGPARDEVGTTIKVSDLNAEIGDELVDSAFQNVLTRAISRGYALFMKAGLSVTLNGKPIIPANFELLVGDEFIPVRTSYDDGEVTVEITAGMAAPPPRDDSPDARIPHYHAYGWYVICNDRVVLAGDKSSRTVWGNEGFNAWHNQYNGFLGVVSFRSQKNPAALPWTTTKRDLDLSHPIYRRSLQRMKAATKPFLEYTNQLKDQEERAARLEESTRPVPIGKIEMRSSMKVPQLERNAPRVERGNVLYRKPKTRLQAAAAALGNRNMSYKEIGSRTFEYYFEREVCED